MIQIRLNENENKIREFFIDSYRKKILTDCVIYCHCLNDDDNSGNVGDDKSKLVLFKLIEFESFFFFK